MCSPFRPHHAQWLLWGITWLYWSSEIITWNQSSKCEVKCVEIVRKGNHDSLNVVFGKYKKFTIIRVRLKVTLEVVVVVVVIIIITFKTNTNSFLSAHRRSRFGQIQSASQQSQ